MASLSHTGAAAPAAPQCTCRAPRASSCAAAPWPVAAARQQQQQRGSGVRCRVADAAVLQDLIVGGAVTAATAAALINGTKGEAEMCSLCAGTGGVRCIICDGSGKMSMTREALAEASKTRDPFSGSRSKRECVACKGACMIFCKNCSGSGYSQRL